MALEMTEVDVEILKVGENALLVTDGDKEAWIPFSLISPHSEINEESSEEDVGEILIPVWKAEEVGFV